MQTITPNLWFDHNAKEAVDFYVSIFPNAKITRTEYYPTEGLADFQKEFTGNVLMVTFTLADCDFVAINAGPEFKPTPASSFMVNFDPSRLEDAREQLDALWSSLIDGGTALMPLQEYDFSEYYGWVQDRYGYSWQLILTNPAGEPRPMIVNSLMFGGPHQGEASVAREYYLETFKNSHAGMIAPYPADTGPAKKGDVMFSDFELEGQWFTAMDSGVEQDFTFNEAVSYSIACKDQVEIDYYWDKLSTVPESEQCGWCKDKFGVSWQINPANMAELMQTPGAFQIMSNQKKIIIDEYKEAK